MSLFPAYDANIPSKSEVEIVDSKNNAIWLKNSSFQPDIIPGSRVISISDSSDSEFLEIPEEKITPVIPHDSDIEEIPPPPKKRKRSKRNKSSKLFKQKIKYELKVENVYFDDRIRDKGNFKVETLCSRARPLYNISSKTLGFIPFKMKKKQPLRRYFASSLDPLQKSKKKDSKNDPQTSPVDSESLITLQQTREEEIKLKIKEFNEKLAEDPQDIDVWIEYINFENRDNNFEILPHNSRAESLKYQRKLAITEKSLEANPNSQILLKLKLNFLNELSPADQYSSQLDLLISKEPQSLILWQALITATRSSISLCTVPKVLKLYSKCFGSLRLWSRSIPEAYDNNLLQMMYQCWLFLRHSGLWEQMWETLRLNLTLNLGITKDSRNFRSSIDEKKLIGMEELILTSKLPLNQLWLRVELLRENCHWVSVGREELELIGDSHRFISPEEVTEFIHPLLSKESNFRLSIYALLALKIPLLPSRHVILEELGMEECNWGIDSVESLLPMVFPCVGEVAGHQQRIHLLEGLIEGITSGPQYLKFHPAQQSFVDFVRDAFRIIAEKLIVEEKNQIYVWWMRFERCLVSVQRSEGVQNEKSKSIKKLKGILKDFLKKEENRNNLDFYREYAEIEREMGRWENCLNILETAIESKGNVLLGIKDFKEQKSVLSLYKTLIECLLDSRNWEVNNKSKILKVFGRMSSGDCEEEKINRTEEYLKGICEEFMNTEVLDEGLSKYFQPSFYYDAVMCYVYFLYISERNFEEIYEVFERCIERSRENRWLEELFWEGKVIFNQMVGERHCRSVKEVQKCLEGGLKRFPDNFYMLSVASAIESELPNWCIRTSTATKRLWPAISLCLSGRSRINSKVCQKDPISKTAALNKLLHFHKRLSKIPEIRCCPLIWRLYMLLLREQNLCQKKGEEIYHESVASCPWARCIYIDAADIAPQLLTQIQDVIKEKDLRMHVTPEELDILRG